MMNPTPMSDPTEICTLPIEMRPSHTTLMGYLTQDGDLTSRGVVLAAFADGRLVAEIATKGIA